MATKTEPHPYWVEQEGNPTYKVTTCCGTWHVNGDDEADTITLRVAQAHGRAA